MKSLTIEYLTRCNLSCKHCAVNASPEATDKAELQDAKSWIAIAKDYGVKDIYLCGGEPFLVFEELCELAKQASSLGLSFTTFSNAFWAQTVENAQRRLLPLRENGLTSLHLSLDCFHLKEGIPLDNFLNAALVANKIGLNVTINVIQTKKKELSANFLKRMFRNYKVSFQFGPLRPLGRAAGLDRSLFINEQKDDYKKGCRSYANPLISPKGNVFACCGAYHSANSINPLSLGSVYDMPFPRIIENFLNLKLLHLIATFGPFLIYELANSKKRELLKNTLYGCEFCCNLLNSEENVAIINERLKDPDPDLKIKLELAELSYVNMGKIRTPRFNAPLFRFCKYRFPALSRFMARRYQWMKSQR